MNATTVEQYQKLLKVNLFLQKALVILFLTVVKIQTLQAVQDGENPPQVMCYCNDTWLVHKERFALVFLRDKRHYGHISTSRVESTHATLKKMDWDINRYVYFFINTLIFMLLLKTPNSTQATFLQWIPQFGLLVSDNFPLLCRNMQQSGQLSTWDGNRCFRR